MRKIMPLPRKFILAVSGGVDSIVAAHLFKQKHLAGLIHVHHGTEKADEYKELVLSQFPDTKVFYYSGPASELHWRNFRERHFQQQWEATGLPICTAHHLNDAIEWWIMSSLRGAPKLMPWRTEKDGKLYKFKPLIQFEKAELVDFARHHNLQWVEDPTNVTGDNDRAKLRRIMPEVLAINPGLPKVIRKKYRS